MKNLNVWIKTLSPLPQYPFFPFGDMLPSAREWKYASHDFVVLPFLFSNFLISSRMIGIMRKHEPKKVLYFSTISNLKAQNTNNTYSGYKIQ